MNLNKILLACALGISAMLLNSCSAPKDIAYFQDAQYDYSAAVDVDPVIKIQPGDKLSIIVNSRDPQMASIFNLPIVSNRVGSKGNNYSIGNEGVSLYTVDPQGNIDFPILGQIHVQGMTRRQIAQHIKQEIMSRDLLQDPTVIVEFGNLYISVVGEVNHPGRFSIEQDQLTVLDALSIAGDLTIYGKRNNVVVVREINGQKKAYKLDLTNTANLFNSPAYYLQQKDVVYVEPNGTKARQSTVNGNTFLQAGFWVSVASLLTSVAVLIFK